MSQDIIAALILAFSPTTPVAEALERAERALSAVRAHRSPSTENVKPRRDDAHYEAQIRAACNATAWALGRHQLLSSVKGNHARIRAVMEAMLSRGELVTMGEGRKTAYQLAGWTAPTGEHLATLLAKHAETHSKK